MKKKANFPLKDVLASFDFNGKGVWNELTDEEKKSINFWLLNRYMSSVRGSKEKTQLAVFKTNEYYNKNLGLLGKADEQLKWQLLCLSGNTHSAEFHEWIGLKHKAGTNGKTVKFLLEVYPAMKEDEVELLARISTKEEIRELATEYDYDWKKLGK